MGIRNAARAARGRRTRGRGDSSDGQRFVQATSTISLEIDRHLSVSELSESPTNPLRQTTLHQPPEFTGTHFNPSQLACLQLMVSNPNIVKSQIAQQVLRAFDHSQLHGSDSLAIRNARAQAGHLRLVLGGQPQLGGQEPDLRLGQADFPQRRANLAFSSSASAGAEVVLVAGVLAIGNDRVAFRSCQRHQMREELLPAEIAAIRGIRHVVSILQLGRLEDAHGNPELSGQPQGFVQFPTWQAGRIRDHRQNTIPQRFSSNPGQKDRIYPARVCHQAGTKRPQQLSQLIQLRSRHRALTWHRTRSMSRTPNQPVKTNPTGMELAGLRGPERLVVFSPLKLSQSLRYVVPMDSTEQASGSTGGIPSTRWSEVEAASDPESADGRRALESQLQRYRPSLIAHLRARFWLNLPEAEDLLHDFVHKKVLQANLFAGAQRGRGHFRSYLLNALDRFVISDLRRQNSRQRRGVSRMVALEELAEAQHPPAPAVTEPPELDWRQVATAGALLDMHRYCLRLGRPDLWEVFWERHLVPTAEGTAPMSYDSLVERFGLPSPAHAHNLLNSAKRVFRRHLRSVVSRYRYLAPEAAEQLAGYAGTPRRRTAPRQGRSRSPEAL